jgi:hypothetical protein
MGRDLLVGRDAAAEMDTGVLVVVTLLGIPRG